MEQIQQGIVLHRTTMCHTNLASQWGASKRAVGKSILDVMDPPMIMMWIILCNATDEDHP